MDGKKERRAYPRIKHKAISIQVKHLDFDTITQSLDVSASGIYCKVKKEIPLMTKLDIVLALPGNKSESKPVLLNVEGVVVREHPVVHDGKIDHYDLAIFFNTIDPKEKQLLVDYIGRVSS
ncbi:MAG: PilZ domain-containing protein [Candidatus Omnitrophica bacterium]|nr:PilZ domain-containing protein [Candidatus Omnitrophota bacterium]